MANLTQRSPLQKLELELKNMSEEPIIGEVAHTLNNRQEESLPQNTSKSSKVKDESNAVARDNCHEPNTPTFHGHDGQQDEIPTYNRDQPAEVNSHHHMAYGAREFLHQHNPFHGFWGKGDGDDASQAVIYNKETLRNEFTSKFARLTLEDMEVDIDAAQCEVHNGRKHFLHTNELHEDREVLFKALPTSNRLNISPVVVPPRNLRSINETRFVDGPDDADNQYQHHHVHHHDPDHPSHHHHPDHLQSPHTKEEREDALIMAYLRAIPGRLVPDRRKFSPPLSIKCGPLLRYTGMRRDGQGVTAKEERETWRGSIMIVTTDSSSVYSPSPSLQLSFVGSKNRSSTSEREQKDTEIGTTGPHPIPSLLDGDKAGKFREIEGLKLFAKRGVTFWRFNIEVQLSDFESRVAYRINNGPLISFWVPARGQAMNIMFHSCNGFSLSVNPDDFCGPDPLWKDVLNKHQKKPFHVMLGGGDQIYNDAVTKQTKHFQAWIAIKTPFQKSAHEFTPEMAEELEKFYLERYSMWFSQGSFGIANSQIPMVNIWDDHDIIDGFGSYPNHFNRCPVFTGLGAVAFRYYMLFQHQSTVEEKEEHEPSWLLGSGPGPYITELSRSTFMFLGRSIAFLGLDCRTERMRDLVLSSATYDKVFARLRKEIVPGETKHLLVLLGVPIAYPRLVWLENLLTSRLMDPIKALSRMGILGGFINNFDGGVELLDDLDDHWTAKNHKVERNWFVKRLQMLSAEFSVRITVLGGDVHLAGIGQFMSNPKLNIAKINDHRYMPNIISSAIVNTPPPNTMADILNKRNKVHHLDSDTDEDMFPLFRTDVDGTPRNNKRLLPRRNYCMIGPHDPENCSSASLEIKQSKRSTFGRIKRNTFKRSQPNKSAQSFPQDGGFDGAAESIEGLDPSELLRDSLEISLRMEINQRDPSGETKPYPFLVPALRCSKKDVARSI